MIAVMAVIQGLMWVLTPEWNRWVIQTFGFLPIRFATALFADNLVANWIAAGLSFLTYFFVQDGGGSLLIYGSALLIFGSALCWRLGVGLFLVFTAICTVVAALTLLVVYWGYSSGIVGAGGGVSGLFGASIHFMFKGSSPSSNFFVAGGAAFRKPAWPLREALADNTVRVWLACFAILNAWYIIAPYVLSSETINPIWAANLGGFVAGVVLFRFLDTRPRLRRVV